MTQDLSVAIREEAPYVVIEAVGEIDVSTASVLRDAMIEVTDAGIGRLVFDLSAVTFVDSVGLGVFVLARKKMQLRRGSVDIIASTRRVLAIFKLAGLEQAFRIRPTLDALAAEDDPAEPA